MNGVGFTSLPAFLGNFRISDNLITCTNETISVDTMLLGFCQGSASVPRGFATVELGAGKCNSTAVMMDTGRDAAPLLGDQCESVPHV